MGRTEEQPRPVCGGGCPCDRPAPGPAGEDRLRPETAISPAVIMAGRVSRDARQSSQNPLTMRSRRKWLVNMVRTTVTEL